METEKIIATEQVLHDKVATISRLVAGLLRDPDAGPASDPLDAAQALRAIADTATSALRQAVPLAREMQGATWEEIGRALGISRQGAYDQFGRTPDQ